MLKREQNLIGKVNWNSSFWHIYTFPNVPKSLKMPEMGQKFQSRDKIQKTERTGKRCATTAKLSSTFSSPNFPVGASFATWSCASNSEKKTSWGLYCNNYDIYIADSWSISQTRAQEVVSCTSAHITETVLAHDQHWEEKSSLSSPQLYHHSQKHRKWITIQ